MAKLCGRHFCHSNTKLKECFELVNNISDFISITMENEVNNKLPFLNACVCFERCRKFQKTSLYRRTTHTGRYINYFSNHPDTD